MEVVCRQITSLMKMAGVLILGLLVMPSLSGAQDKSPGLGTLNYAKTYKTSVAEAERRLEKTDYIFSMQRIFREGSPDTFAGLYIEHEPVYRVVVMFVGDARSQFSDYTLDPLFVPKSAPRSLELLESVQKEIGVQLARANIEFVSGIDVKNSRIDLSVKNPQEVAKRLAKLISVANFIRIRKGTGRIETTAITGGGRIKGPRLDPRFSTSGFNVVDSNRELGVITAGHTPNPSRYIPTSTLLDLQAELDAGSYDVEWHKQRITSATPEQQSNKIAVPGLTDINSTTNSASYRSLPLRSRH
jgi:hypothetical protein